MGGKSITRRLLAVTASLVTATLSFVATALLPPPADAVANGTPAPPGAFPFSVKFTMTNIPRPDGSHYDSACSGALIAAQWVITAGHCFHDVNRNPVSGPVPYETTATLGKVDLADKGGLTLDVIEVRQSPVNDIALAKLAKPVTGIQPIQIDPTAPEAGDTLVLAGWGATSSTNPASTQLNLGKFKVSTVADTTIGVHGISPSANTSACPYDSGAPYFRPIGRKSGTLVSVESGGAACPTTEQETTSRVDVITQWIYDQIKTT